MQGVIIMKEELRLTGDIRAEEVNRLLASFWGKESSIAHYQDPIIDYSVLLSKIETLLPLPQEEGRKRILEDFSGQTISLGLRYGENLVAHSALIIQPWGDVETAGSIIDNSHHNMSLMAQINIRKKELIAGLTRLGLQPTSYVILGSKSVDYGYTLFDIPEINLKSWFCNIGPYVYKRSKDPERQESAKITDLSLETDQSIISSSSQVVGIREDSQPIIARNAIRHLPNFWKELLEYFPNSPVLLTKLPKVRNTVTEDKAEMMIYVIREPIQNFADFLSQSVRTAHADKTVFIKIPLTETSNYIIDQIDPILHTSYDGVLFIPTGLTLVDNCWSITMATILEERLPHYKHLLTKISEAYTDSLQNVADLSSKYIR